MREIFFTFFTLIHLFAHCQDKFISLDTLSSKEFEEKLLDDYKLKYDIFNKNFETTKNDQIKILKEIYSENQKEFLESVKNNNFISDKSINLYLQKLLNEVLYKNNIPSNNYKILLSKDSEINAHNLGDGTIVINYGLFLILENEDELVFVISHEIGHQYLNHVKNEIENFAKQSTSEEIIKKTNEIRKQKYSKATLANTLLKNIRYKNYRDRRKKETEADSLGINLYKKTLRNPKQAINLLSKLDKSNLEIDSLIVEDYKEFFEKGEFKLKAKYFESETSLFQKYDSKSNFMIDSLKTHPDCLTRINLLNKNIDQRVNSLTNSPIFSEIKKNSVCQNLLNLYENKDYGICLYETLKYYKHDKKNDMYKKILYGVLRDIYKSKSNYTISKYIPNVDFKNKSKSFNTFINFVNNIKINDLEIIINQSK